MKKFLTLLLFVLLAVALVFSCVACQQKTKALKEDLIGSLLENTSNETQSFEANVSAIRGGEKVVSGKILGYGTQDNVNADAYFLTYGELGAMVLRNNAPYIVSLETNVSVAPENLQAEVEKRVYNNPDVIFNKQPENFLADRLGISGGMDTSDMLENFPEEDLAKFAEIGETLSRNLMSLVFNKVEQTDDGYLLAMDLHKLFEDIWNKVYAVAKTIDKNNKITISELYASKPMRKIMSSFLDGVSGKQMEELLKFVGEIPEVTLPFGILTADDKETATDYIGRYLETIKIEGTITLGSMRVADLISSNGNLPDLTDQLDKIKTELDKELLERLKNDFVFELRFDKSKKLVEAKISISNLESPMQYDNILVEVNLLDEQPLLLDATKINSVSASDVKLTKCEGIVFWERDYSGKFTLKDGDLYAVATYYSDYYTGVSAMVKRGTDSAFWLGLRKENGQWSVNTDLPDYSYEYDLTLTPVAEFTVDGNNILLNYSLIDENGTIVLDLNFTITFDTIAH